MKSVLKGSTLLKKLIRNKNVNYILFFLYNNYIYIMNNYIFYTYLIYKKLNTFISHNKHNYNNNYILQKKIII
jgi:hypothetical protein